MKLILQRFGAMVCAITRKHKRGRRHHGNAVLPEGHARFICPRCGKTWVRKVKVKA